MKIIIIGALPSSLINFRGKLLETFVSEDVEFVAMASNATKKEIEQIESLGVRYIDYPVQRNGLNPVNDFKTFKALRRVFKQEKPDVILSYTIKPVIWGGIAARFSCKANFFGLITGLGFAFQKGGLKRNLLTYLVKGLYRFALASSEGVIFQNPDNLNVFVENKIIPKKKTALVNGSGVDLSHFKQVALPVKPIFLLVARLLGEKGIREYADAARVVKEKYPEAVFQLVGPEDSSPDGIRLDEVNEWKKNGFIDYLGATSDVRPYFANCSVFVLPSYHEGMPRTVLEAMATGRPILTTNVAGCRETVINGQNGYLVAKQNVEQLAERMIWFIENQHKWQAMADKSRQMAIERFDVHKVNEQLLKIMGIKK
ncbi:MAG: glycosyltransferase family 4 protein [Alteromonadaceae bacterium]|nr:glycosyltransferase family 4 protein [Alteromonadaceae bacterium]